MLGVSSFLVAVSESWFKEQEIALECRAGPAVAVARLRAAVHDPQKALEDAQAVFAAWKQHPRSSPTQKHWYRQEEAQMPSVQPQLPYKSKHFWDHLGRVDELLAEVIGIVQRIGDAGLLCSLLEMLETFSTFEDRRDLWDRGDPNVPLFHPRGGGENNRYFTATVAALEAAVVGIGLTSAVQAALTTMLAAARKSVSSFGPDIDWPNRYARLEEFERRVLASAGDKRGSSGGSSAGAKAAKKMKP